MKILVVDDTRIILSVVEAILVQDQQEVFTAADGREGYAVFGEIHPDMVITDIEMPWQDGLTMMRSIRRIRPDVFTLYMTGNPGPYQQRLDEEVETYAAGLLHKPFTRGELLCGVRDVVAKALPLQRALRTLTEPEAIDPLSECTVKRQLASLSSACFQREEGFEKEGCDVSGNPLWNGLHAGGRG